MLIGYLNLYFWQIIPKHLRHLWYSIKVMVRAQHGSEGAVNRQHLSVGRSTCTSMQKTQSSICWKMSCNFSLLNLPFIQKNKFNMEKKNYITIIGSCFFFPSWVVMVFWVDQCNSSRCLCGKCVLCLHRNLLAWSFDSEWHFNCITVCLFVCFPGERLKYLNTVVLFIVVLSNSEFRRKLLNSFIVLS